ncbi:MAG: hypothetical protein QXS44_01570 [Saccharolobus sp.]
MFSNSLFPILIPSPDGKMDISTIINLYDIAYGLDVKPLFLQASVSGLLYARNSLFDILKNYYKKITGEDKKIVRGLMIDSDIVIPSSSCVKITEAIKEANLNRYSFVIPYNNLMGTSIFIKEDNKLKNVVDPKELKTIDKCYASGLGFYYGDLPLDYRFNFNNNQGEDINFFIDNKIEPRVINIPILHNKLVKLTLEVD